MRYLLLMWTAEAPTAPEPGDTAEPCWLPWTREMDASGVLLGPGEQLQAADRAVTVRSRADEALVTDGPFAETKEQIAGYQIIECPDLDAAILAASRHPVARQDGGFVEVREFLV
jgi:hypothetical protein